MNKSQDGVFSGDGETRPTNWKLGAVLYGQKHEGVYFVDDHKKLHKNKCVVKRWNIPDDVDMKHMNEVDIHKKIKHHRILEYYGYSITTKVFSLFIPYMKMGTLANFMKTQKDGRLTERQTALFTLQILEGLEYLHENKLIHRDIKGSNILMKDDMNIQITDFGEAKILSTLTKAHTQKKGSIHWMAPEVIKELGYTEKVDIWSLGCTVVQMVTGKIPFHDLSENLIVIRVIKDSFAFSAPENISTNLKDFLLRSCEMDYSKRPDASELLKHTFVTDIQNVAEVGQENYSDILDKSMRSYLDQMQTHNGCFEGDGENEPTNWTRGEVIMKQNNTTVCHVIDSNKLNENDCVAQQVYIRDDTDGTDLKSWMVQIQVLEMVNHHRIIAYYGYSRTDNVLSIFLPKMKGGSLSGYIKRQANGRLSEKMTSLYTYQILEGLEYLHNQKIIHRDIKGSTILMQDEMNVKISDFEVSKTFKTQSKISSHAKGTIHWMAPEILQEIPYDSKVDIWSLGCTVYQMITGEVPFADLTFVKIVQRAIKHELVLLAPADTSPNLKKFLSLSCEGDPSKRPSATELMQHDFVKDAPFEQFEAEMMRDYPNGCPENTFFKRPIRAGTEEVNVINVSDVNDKYIHKKIKKYIKKYKKENTSIEITPYFHATTHTCAKSILLNGIKLDKGSEVQDFSNGDGFYLQYEFSDAKENACRNPTPAIIVYNVPNSVMDDNDNLGLNINPCDPQSIKKWKQIITFYRRENAEQPPDDIDSFYYIKGPVCENAAGVLKGDKPRPSFKYQLCIKNQGLVAEFGKLKHVVCVIFYK